MSGLSDSILLVSIRASSSRSPAERWGGRRGGGGLMFASLRIGQTGSVTVPVVVLKNSQLASEMLSFEAQGYIRRL